MKQNIILIFAFSLLVFTACEDVIDVKLSDELLDLYAVEAKITSESNPSVYLYKSKRVDEDGPYPTVSGATVTISDDSQPSKSIQLIESTTNKGLYIPSEKDIFKGEVGKEYTITIEHEGVTITGSERLSKVEPIDSIQIHPSLRGDNMFLGVFTYGNEPAGLGNYYKWDLYVNGQLLYDAEYLMIASDELVDGNYISSFEIFTDFHDINKPEERIIKLGDSVLIKQLSISEFAYKYYFQMFNQNDAGGLFSVPPANIKSNFTSSNGKPVLGIFTASDVSVSNVVTITKELDDMLDD